MSSNSPVGLFDSGVGGLSVMREVRRTLPAEDLIYYADSAHCPYGQKQPEEIRRRMFAIGDLLISKGAKLLVVACNTASIAGLDAMRSRFSVPIVGMEPAVKPATAGTRNGRIGVLATNVALSGDRFVSLVDRYGEGFQVITQPCPGLVGLVEAGMIDGPEVEEALRRYLAPLQEQGVDTVVLGCTHYPFLRGVVERLCGPGVTIIDTGEAVARQVGRVLERFDLLNEGPAPGKDLFITSGDADEVAGVIKKLLGDSDPVVLHDPAE